MSSSGARKRVAVLVSRNGTNLQALIDACANPAFPAEIVRVISNRAEAYGLVRAQKAGIDTLIIDHKTFAGRDLFDRALHEALVECGTEIVCLAGFMRLLTSEFTKKWEGRMLNIHPSLLPAFPGLDTHKRAIEAGVKFSGCTVHFVTAEMDAGPIIVQAAVPILADDTPDALAARILAQEHRCYVSALQWLAEGKLEIAGNRVMVKTSATLGGALINPHIM